ncbi:Ribonuclease P protein component [Corynebacterium atrinae]|uniref:ribonuclease P protein component n=1 Tax=Corynebacterium atrinae TaxID=1336740 RepID=UPI0025B33FDF|nr:ribonuclease P protein component [Corynebacterium atrinae]WJY64674.1 Ribonuclease P protein component [Corynebacterium atrinae]
MLPQQQKFTSPSDFSRTIKRGRRAGTRTVVVHLVDRSSMPDADIALQGGPRVGLIVSKAVGNAVIRHRTSRRLRHICVSRFGSLPKPTDLVIRALPAAGTASSSELDSDLNKALKKLGVGHG